MKGNPPSTVVNSSLEVPDQDLMSDARIILAVRVQVRRLRAGVTGLPRDRLEEAGQIHLLVPRFQQLQWPMQRVPTPCAMVRLCRSRG